MIKKNIEKLERKNRRKPAMPSPIYERTKAQRLEAHRKKFKKDFE